MKLKTKLLLPVFAAATTMVTMPLVTSCSKAYMIIWRENQEEQIPEIQPVGPIEFDNLEEATDAYFEDITDDMSLLAREIFFDLHGGTQTNAGKIVQTKIYTNVNKTTRKVSFTSSNIYQPEDSKSQYSYLAQAQNTEFCIYKSLKTETHAARWVFAPKILMEVQKAYEALTGKIEVDPAPLIRAALDHADKLAKDNSWFFTYTEQLGDSEYCQYSVSSRNIYEYVELIFYGEYDPTFYFSLKDYGIITTWFSQIRVKGVDNEK